MVFARYPFAGLKIKSNKMRSRKSGYKYPRACIGCRNETGYVVLFLCALVVVFSEIENIFRHNFSSDGNFCNFMGQERFATEEIAFRF